MALQQILEKILADATEKANFILSNAKTHARDMAEKSEKESLKSCEAITKTGEQKIAAMHQKIENLAAHREKSDVLAAKREILGTVLSAAKKAIAQKSPAEKEKLFAAMLSQIDAEKGEIRPVAADAEILKKVLQHGKKHFAIGKEITGISGFVFVSPEMEMDFRVEEICDRLVAPAVEEKLSRLLF